MVLIVGCSCSEERRLLRVVVPRDGGGSEGGSPPDGIGDNFARVGEEAGVGDDFA